MRKLWDIFKNRLTPLIFLVVIFAAASLLLTSYSIAAVGQDKPQSTVPTTTELTKPGAVKPSANPSPKPAEPENPSLAEQSSALLQIADLPALKAGAKPLHKPSLEPEYSFLSGRGKPVYNYTYGNPVPESEPVDDDFFSDAVFLGDSRTEGFKLYSGLKTADIFAARSINVVSIQYERVIENEYGDYITILEALAQNPYTKVYIMLGINEIGYKPEYYQSEYELVIQEIRNIQPNADIFIQAVIPVTENKHNDDSGFTNTKIELFNQKAAELAEKYSAFYVDTYNGFLNEEGFLPSDASSDGIHLYQEYCVKWLEYLKSHTLLSYERAAHSKFAKAYRTQLRINSRTLYEM